MGQRLRSQQNAVVDIAPEQYQKLRQSFLSELTREQLNQELRQQLTQELTMVLIQPQGEAETNVKMLQESWNKVMAVPDAPAAPAPDESSKAENSTDRGA